MSSYQTSLDGGTEQAWITGIQTNFVSLSGMFLPSLSSRKLDSFRQDSFPQGLFEVQKVQEDVEPTQYQRAQEQSLL